MLTDSAQVCAKLHEYLRGDAFTFTNQAEENVLCTDVVVPQLQRFAQREFEHLLGAWCERNVPRRRTSAVPDDLFNLGTYRLQADPERLKRLGGNALAFVNEAEENVLCPDVVVVQQARFFLR